MVFLLSKFVFNAGSMKILFSNGTIYILSGGVSIKTENYDIKGSSGKYYENLGKVFLNYAKIKSANLFLSSKFLYYNRNTKFLELKGDAFFEDRYRKISGNIIRSKNDSAWVFGNVDVISKKRSIRIRGDSAFYDGKNAFGWIKRNAKAIIPASETLHITANMFLMHRDTTFGYDSVKIVSKSIEATSDTFIADIKGDTLRRVFLFGNTHLKWKNGNGSSKSCEILFENGEVRTVILRDSARVVYNEGGGTIEVEGSIIKATVINDTLKHISVEKLKRGVYK